LFLFEIGGSFGVLLSVTAIVLVTVLYKRKKAKRKQEGMNFVVDF
jgi:hypothetical protein